MAYQQLELVKKWDYKSFTAFRFCDKCNKKFKPSSKYSRICNDCYKLKNKKK